jgi:hypothetical protein
LNGARCPLYRIPPARDQSAVSQVSLPAGPGNICDSRPCPRSADCAIGATAGLETGGTGVESRFAPNHRCQNAALDKPEFPWVPLAHAW